MPRFFFDTVDGIRVRDTAGLVLPDLEAARRQSILLAGMLLHDEPDFLMERDHFVVEVTNQNHDLVFSLVIRAVTAPVPADPGINW